MPAVYTPPPKPKPKGFDGNYQHATDTGAQPGSPAPPPDVPGPHGSTGNGVHVNTPSLVVFANNVDTLNNAVNTAYERLSPIRPVAPGAFKQANDIRAKVNNDDGGLKAAYLKVLDDLNNGLLELRDGIRALAAKYQSVEDVNSITADKLNKAIENANPLFGQLGTDGTIK
jgi:hypothetical protein